MQIPIQDIQDAFLQIRHTHPVGSSWSHYKGGFYMITGYGFDTGRGGINIAYRRIRGPNFDAMIEANIRYHRPLADWHPDKFKEIP